MPSYSSFTVIGHVTADPEMKILPSGTNLTTGSIAVNENFKGSDGEAKEDVNFFDYTIWGKRAETFAKYVAKGDPVFMTGTLKQNRWETDDGQKRSKVELNVREFKFLRKKGDNPSTGQGEADDEVPF